jgi:hypothetical protein
VCVVLNNADAMKSLPKHSNGGAQMAQSTVPVNSIPDCLDYYATIRAPIIPARVPAIA